MSGRGDRGRGRGGGDRGGGRGGARGGAPTDRGRGGGGGGGDRGGRGGPPARGGGGGGSQYGGSEAPSRGASNAPSRGASNAPSRGASNAPSRGASSMGGGGGDRGRGRGGGDRGGGGRGRGGDRGGGGRGGGGGGGGGGPVAAVQGAPSTTNYGSTAVSIASHVQATGVKRPSFGTAGRVVDIVVNCFKCNVPTGMIYHYDVTILPDDKVLPQRANMKIIRAMQEAHPNIFTRKGSYDGRKNLYSTIPYSFGQQQQFEFQEGNMPMKVRLQKAAEINPEILSRYIAGNATHDDAILTALNACNVAIRMQPIENNPFNTRSFFTRNEYKDLRGGLELWRGYFQSVRPVIGKMVINLDISSAIFYKSGPLINVILDFLGVPANADPTPHLGGNMDNRKKNDILKFIRGLQVKTERAGRSQTRTIKGLSAKSAEDHIFQAEHGPTTIAAYYSLTTGRTLRYPKLLSVQLSTKAFIPLERCEVVFGQLMRKQVPSHLTKDVVEFSTMAPDRRLNSIRNGLQVLQYGNSEYLQQFGINVEANPMQIKARVLQAPMLQYAGSTIQPKDGAWNMRDKKLYKPSAITGCVMIVYDQRFRGDDNIKRGLFEACRDLGITGMTQDFPVIRKNASGGNYGTHLKEAAMAHKNAKGTFPNLILAVLPEFGSEDIYTRIKHAGDIEIGVSTQCLKGSKNFKASNPQYYANVCLKINVKLGGINVIPQPAAVRFLTDPTQPTLVIGADVMHPGPGTQGRPSFAAVTGNVDSNTSKYVAISKAQTPRREMIEELDKMVLHIITMYMNYRRAVEKVANVAPKRIIFYRDGISEGQFKECIDFEVKKIKEACQKAKLPVMPKLTFVVVGKRHHVRFFPTQGGGDRSGNAPAGLVVDRDVTSPVEFDFYLQSHGGLLGTSRSAHYNVLVDENQFVPDDLQKLSFSLCHVYARSTRSVSIVPPVYYADTVCARAKHHFNPDGNFGDLSETGTTVSSSAADAQLESYKQGFRPLHNATSQTMYFQ